MSQTTITNWMLTASLAALIAGPLAATPIVNDSTGTDTLTGGSLTYQVTMKPNGAAIDTQGFVPGGSSVTLTSTGNMVLSNILEPGTDVTSAILNLGILNSLTQGQTLSLGCVGDACSTYNAPSFQLAASSVLQTTITVASTSGTTYTWTQDLGLSNPFQLDLATANPDFLADLSDGQDLNITWTQSVQVTGQYPNPQGNNKCANCVFTFQYSGLSQTSTLQASLSGDANAVPEPSTALLLGLGIMGLTAVLRRRVS